MELGYVPSFCTACYREGRVGDRFMEICKEQKIHNFCHPNAIMTLKEYLEDYASTETKKVGINFPTFLITILFPDDKIQI